MSTALLVDCHKIINWLQQRKKLQKDWYNYLKAAEEKLRTLLKDSDWTLSYPQMHALIQTHNQNFTFLEVQAFLTLLLESDLAQKNLLFGYSDKRVKEWVTLKKYMEKNSLNLLNVAKFIEQSLRFDLPAIAKSIEGLDSQLANLKRKIDFNRNTIVQQTTLIVKEKSLLGVESQTERELPIDQLLKLLIKRAPQQISHFEDMVRKGKATNFVEHYNNFTGQLPGNELKALEFFLKQGDQFEEVQRDSSLKDQYSNVKKYEDFVNWREYSAWEIQIEGATEEKKLNKTTVIQNRQFRLKLLYDLNQLLFFFKGVRYSLTSGKGLQFQSNSSMVEGDAQSAIQTIQQLLSFLTSKKLTAPLQLKGSKKAYQMLINQFTGSEKNIIEMESQIISYSGQIKQLQIKRAQEAERLAWLRKKVKESKGSCEGWLTTLVKRDVKIIGQINKLE